MGTLSTLTNLAGGGGAAGGGGDAGGGGAGGGGYSGKGEIKKGPRVQPFAAQNQLQVTGPIVSFGGDVIRPAGPENGGGGQGLTTGPVSGSGETALPDGSDPWGGQYVSPGTTVPFSSLSGATPAAYTPVSYTGGYQPALFDTINKGPSFQLSGIAIAALAAGAGLVFFLARRGNA